MVACIFLLPLNLAVVVVMLLLLYAVVFFSDSCSYWYRVCLIGMVRHISIFILKFILYALKMNQYLTSLSLKSVHSLFRRYCRQL